MVEFLFEKPIHIFLLVFYSHLRVFDITYINISQWNGYL